MCGLHNLLSESESVGGRAKVGSFTAHLEVGDSLWHANYRPLGTRVDQATHKVVG